MQIIGTLTAKPVRRMLTLQAQLTTDHSRACKYATSAARAASRVSKTAMC